MLLLVILSAGLQSCKDRNEQPADSQQADQDTISATDRDDQTGENPGPGPSNSSNGNVGSSDDNLNQEISKTGSSGTAGSQNGTPGIEKGTK